MTTESLFGIILLSIAGGAFVYCLIQARSAREICNDMMKDIERYLKKSKQMELPLAMPVKKKKVTKTKRKAKK